MTILSVYRESFSLAPPRVVHMPEGLTLAQMMSRMPSLPEDFADRGVICINGSPVSRDCWPLVRPRVPAVTEVTFHHAPGNGGEDGGKSVLALVASIALTVATGWIAGGGIASRFGTTLFAANSVSALALSAGVSLVGSLLLSALVPPPSVQSSATVQNPGAASAEGNVLQANSPIPRVIGLRKIYPPLAMEPLTYFDGPDEVVEAAYVLAGPHQISDIRLGAAAISSISDVEYEVREGWEGSPLINIIRRQARTESLQAELRGHVVNSNDGRTLESVTGDTSAALPQVQVVATRDAPDEHHLHLIFAQGLHRNASETDRMRVPLRLRLRAIGDDDWVNLPELHFQAASIRQLRTTIRLIWTDDAGTTPAAATSEGWVEARSSSPGQTAAPATGDWAADAYFYAGSGDAWQSAANLGSTGVDHVILDRYTATIYLDSATFPPGRYEIDIQRGASFLASDYSADAYTVDGSVWDFWGYQGTPGQIVMTRDGVADSLYLLRSVSIWNEHPLPSRDLAVVAIRARNRAADAVSCIAGGYVRDWDGSGWNDWVVTGNPAPHLRDIWVGAENQDPVPADLIDDDGLVAWRQHCIDMGYTCNALLEDQTVDDAARIVAACGYAKPYMSEIWGVVRDYDRSSEAPVQMFTPRNMANFQWTKAFARVPDGFRVNFRDSTRDYEMHQVAVFRAGVSDDAGRMEQITLEGLVHEADAVARARYDQSQAQLRSTFYSGEVSAEVVLCRRGDLVAVQHDVLTEWAGAARIASIETDTSGDVVSITLDTEVPVAAYDFLNEIDELDEEDDLSLAGLQSGAAIRRRDGVTTHQIDSATGATLTFSPAISPDGLFDGDENALDALVAVGPLGSETLRLIVFGVTPRENFGATITMVDEAPQLWS